MATYEKFAPNFVPLTSIEKSSFFNRKVEVGNECGCANEKIVVFVDILSKALLQGVENEADLK